MKKHWYAIYGLLVPFVIAGFRVAKSHTRPSISNVTQQNILLLALKKIEKAISIKQARANFPRRAGRAYDKMAVMSAIQNRWYNLLDTEKFIPSSEPDKIVVTFELHEDGNVTGTKVNGGTNWQLRLPYVCSSAIKDHSGFCHFKNGRTRCGSIVKTNVREIRFVFYIKVRNHQINRKYIETDA